ncbi:AbrB/MazE/SpoVT family DNA-binding domain-containing protein [Shimazuella kribbensis]|uniref:AbrB/MazE/SpoVT family DNA-binding domain-containing protein n=1 Tax=Shimazuella kribbensis TaxID=139808 RepID=UPI000425EC90|nr:AbrB/MazE/SpoVT family DNA-binding domain-containing protein [Shimazuella kribbensis]
MAVKEVERKVTKIGNSLGVTLPAEILKHLHVKQGDEVIFYLEEGKVSFKKRPAVNIEGFEDIDQEFLEGMKKLFDNYDDTLRNLVKR